MNNNREPRFDFTLKHLEAQYQVAIDNGYRIITCAEYCKNKKYYQDSEEKIIVNRIDIDLSVKKTAGLVDIYNRLGIKGSFFLRLHAPEYNPFSFESYRTIMHLINSGHELGYHSEIIDQSIIWNETAEDCLIRDINVLNTMFNIKVEGVASHGGMTGYNNLDFWKDKHASQYGLLYEAYDKSDTFNLFDESFYISDSEWTKWKCYDKGKLVPGDNRSFGEHLAQGHKLIYLLIHPDTYFVNHFYE